MSQFIRFGAMLAILGGVLRMLSVFLPFQPNSPWLEALYGIVDLSLLFGLIGLFVVASDRIGRVGQSGFVLAAAGFASIVGPDSAAFGINFYSLGSSAIVFGLGILSLQMLRAGMFKASSYCWLVTLVLGLVYSAVQNPWWFMAAGVALGFGFILAGAKLVRSLADELVEPSAGAPHPR